MLIRLVLDVTVSRAALRINPAGSALDESNSFREVINPYDAVALDAAVRLKEMRRGSTEIVAVAVRGTTQRAVPVWCKPYGADRVITVADAELSDADCHLTSLVLAKVIADLGCDLVMCGKTEVDFHDGQVAGALAELLGLPHVTGIVKLEVDDDATRAVVHRRLEKGDREIVECSLPAVLSTDIVLNKPRYPSFLARRAIVRVPHIEHTLAGLGFTQDGDCRLQRLTMRERLSQPRPRTKRTFTPDSSLSLAERMKAIASGGLATRSSRFVEGAPELVVDEIARYLVEEKLI